MALCYLGRRKNAVLLVRAQHHCRSTGRHNVRFLQASVASKPLSVEINFVLNPLWDNPRKYKGDFWNPNSVWFIRWKFLSIHTIWWFVSYFKSRYSFCYRPCYVKQCNCFIWLLPKYQLTRHDILLCQFLTRNGPLFLHPDPPGAGVSLVSNFSAAFIWKLCSYCPIMKVVFVAIGTDA